MAYEQSVHPRIQQAMRTAYLLSPEELERQLQVYGQIRASQDMIESAVGLGALQLSAAQDFISNYFGNYRQAKFTVSFTPNTYLLKFFNFDADHEDGVELEISRHRIVVYRLTSMLNTPVRREMRSIPV